MSGETVHKFECAVFASDVDAQLTAHLEAAGMAKQFWPESLLMVAEMPKTPSGKIQKYVLRQQL